MGFVALVVVVGSVLCALLRTVVLSRHAGRFLAHDVWLYDVGMRYACLVVGVVALVFFRFAPGCLGRLAADIGALVVGCGCGLADPAMVG